MLRSSPILFLPRHVARKLIPSSIRRYTVPPHPISTPHLLHTLCKNPELNEEDASNELRWLQTALSESPLPPSLAGKSITELVTLRAGGMPLQYILGSTDFGPLTLQTRPPTLIPRPETAHCFSLLPSSLTLPPDRPLRVLDLCTGSGAIPLLLEHLLGSRVSVWGVDVVPSAVGLAKENAGLLKSGLDVWEGDIFDPLFAEGAVERIKGRVDLVTSNPPYITRSEMLALPTSVKGFEDPRALIGDLQEGEEDGLAFYHRIATLLPHLLSPGTRQGEGPIVALEIGHTQSPAVQEILKTHSGGIVGRTECVVDQWGRDRMIIGYGK